MDGDSSREWDFANHDDGEVYLEVPSGEEDREDFERAPDSALASTAESSGEENYDEQMLHLRKPGGKVDEYGDIGSEEG